MKSLSALFQWGGWVVLATLLALVGPLTSARANVYASNIKLNGQLADLTVAPGQPVTIDYILNEPALLGVTVDILSGGTVVRSLTFPGGGSPALAGTNSVVWDGLDSSSNAVPVGTYAVRITAATSGYTNWQQLTVDDYNGNTFVNAGRGIAVDCNTNSPYYGRVFVANALAGVGPVPGWNVGVLKFNADASAADEGAIDPGQNGYDWGGNGLSPWKLEVSGDDAVYVNDLNQGGLIYSWAPTFTSNSLTPVLQLDNLPTGAHLRGQALAGSGTNAQLWMADDGFGLGLLRWSLTNGACATNDTGTTIVSLGTNSPADVALDTAGNIYTCVAVSDTTNPAARVFCFPAYDPSTNAGQPELSPTWAVGQADDNYGGASGIAVAPSGQYVAVSFEGVIIDGILTNGCTRVFYATNGALAADLDLNVPMDETPETEHDDLDCAWDAVGNLYYIDDWYGMWRAFSPPGTNQATTVAAITIHVGNAAPPQITGLTVAGGTVTIHFTGSASDTAADFTLLSADTLAGPFAAADGASISQISAGVFQATVPVGAPVQFYRIRR